MSNKANILNIQNTYLGILFIILISIKNIELHYVLYVVTCFLYLNNPSRRVINLMSYLVIIFFLATISSFFTQVTLYDWIKDFSYFTKPIIGVLAGFLLAKKVKDLQTIIKIIVSIAFLSAIYHILIVLIKIDFSVANVSNIRTVGGISNDIETIAIVFLIVSFKKNTNITIIRNTLFKKAILVVLAVSFILYFSRTMIVSITIFLLAAFGYLKITNKGLKYLSLVLLFFGLFYVYLFSVNIERGKSGFESFLYKMKNAPAEIFSPAKQIDTKNHEKLWDRWRAYEASMALNQIESAKEVIIGKGLGALVDLKFPAPLGNENIRYIPILHNGYVNIFFKSGLLGLVLYFLLLLLMYLYSRVQTNNLETKLVTNLIGGLAVYYFFTTLIITGIYNKADIYVFVLGILLYFSNNKQIIKEKN